MTRQLCDECTVPHDGPACSQFPGSNSYPCLCRGRMSRVYGDNTIHVRDLTGASPVPPVERRATVAEKWDPVGLATYNAHRRSMGLGPAQNETRLALLERLLVDVTKKWDTWSTSLEDGQSRFAEDNAWEALGAAIEAARAATTRPSQWDGVCARNDWK